MGDILFSRKIVEGRSLVIFDIDDVPPEVRAWARLMLDPCHAIGGDGILLVADDDKAKERDDG